MRIVRTVGQAFEVCHKLSMALATSNACEEAHSLSGNEAVDILHDHSNKGFTLSYNKILVGLLVILNIMLISCISSTYINTAKRTILFMN